MNKKDNLLTSQAFTNRSFISNFINEQTSTNDNIHLECEQINEKIQRCSGKLMVLYHNIHPLYDTHFKSLYSLTASILPAILHIFGMGCPTRLPRLELTRLK